MTLKEEGALLTMMELLWWEGEMNSSVQSAIIEDTAPGDKSGHAKTVKLMFQVEDTNKEVGDSISIITLNENPHSVAISTGSAAPGGAVGEISKS